MAHQIKTQEGKIIYDTGSGYFEPVQPKERYRSSRYNELVLDYSTDTSYRKIEGRINRIRQQEEGSKTTTIRNVTEREGQAMNFQMKKQAWDALEQNGFTIDGEKEEETPMQSLDTGHMDEAAVMGAAEELGLAGRINMGEYEDPEQTVNISVDDVGVKRQVSTRPDADEKGGRKYVYQTIVHVARQTGSYILNGHNQRDALIMLLGFLLSNGLLWTNSLVFYMDGDTTLLGSIKKVFGFLPIKIILDWYHLDKKLKERLSMGMAGYKLRNKFLEQLRPLLWMGDVGAAVSLLRSLPEKQVKSPEHIQKLIEYLCRNQPYIPCYALRAKLGLCNSSNRGEKANDLAVADRQKHNGMSWSKDGSVALASICAASQNNELLNWVSSRSLDFSLHYDAA